MVPFWKGENVGRSHGLGLALGAFLRELQERLDRSDCLQWLEQRYCLDRVGARNVQYYVQRQLLHSGCLPTDHTIYVEAFRDPLGDWQVILLSPFGQRLHLALRLAIEARLRERLGYRPQCLHHNDGILVRLTDTDEPVLDLLDGLRLENVEDLVLQELGDSALFALRFRQNAARALLLPRTAPCKRAPLWLQRLRGRDLLQAARRHQDFPIVIETFRECLRDHLDVPQLKALLGDISEGRVSIVARRVNGPSPFAGNLLFAFTAASMYDGDQVESEPRPEHVLNRELLDQLVRPEGHAHLTDPRAIQQVERRLRGVGRPPRSKPEMAEWLRRLGDLSNSELEGPMPAFLEELERDGTVVRIQLPRCREPERWVLQEEQQTYQSAFGSSSAPPETVQAAGEAILYRFLTTHALVGLQDILDRYPFDESWTRRKLEEWSAGGRVVVTSPAPLPSPTADPARWAVLDNLDQVQRTSLALERSEVVSCSPAQFADFLLRWQHVHPQARVGTSAGLTEVLDRLEGISLPPDLWQRTVLPSRVLAYQPRWLEEQVSGGEWVAVGGSDGTERPVALAFWRRDNLASLPMPSDTTAAPTPESERILGALQSRGACFVTDLAQATELSPATVRAALTQLSRRGLVTNDQLAVMMNGAFIDQPRHAETPRFNGVTRSHAARRRPPLFSRPEGRWSLVSWGHPDTAHLALFQASLLLNRYGVAGRELALLDPSRIPWRVLYEVLSRMEFAGHVRRGYFVEGLSGAQFAWPDAVRELQNLHLPSTASAPIFLIHSLDPANLYGAGAPFDIPLLDGGTRPLLRRAGNWLVLRAGRPVLIIEQHGHRLTALPSASQADLVEAAQCLQNIATLAPESHRLTVQQWNGQPVTSTIGRELLEAAGFVRDYQAMTLYAAFATTSRDPRSSFASAETP
jgi:ATP-dependent Lhr-like helicase